MNIPPIALLTDFGSDNIFIGVMKGVIRKICPQAVIIDFSHEISAQNIKQAAFLLYTNYHYCPDNTIFVTVVDPGVGTDRMSIAVRSEDRFFIAPDNGVLSCILNRLHIDEIVHLNNSNYHLPNVSQTFHGRDIFSPVAAHITEGVHLSRLGEQIKLEQVNRDFDFTCRIDPDHVLSGEVIHIDRFGNMITTIHKDIFEEWLDEEEPDLMVLIADKKIKTISRTYADVKEGKLLAYIGSCGYLEIGVRNGNASQILGGHLGMEMQINRI